MSQVLPEPLAGLWKGQEYAISHLNVNGMTSVVIQGPKEEIEGWRGVKTLARMELHRMPTAPVFRLYVEFKDRPGEPFGAETFFEISKPDDKENLRLLSAQDELVFHFFENKNQGYLYSKTVNWYERQRVEVGNMLRTAEAHLATVKNYDFGIAKQEVMKRNPI